VAVAIVRAPAGCRASGAACFLHSDKALIQLSLRYRTDDHFWFTFFHEAAHLALHAAQGLFVDADAEATPPSLEEQEANQFAADVLIPARYRAEFEALPLSGRRVIAFARSMGVSPGIIVGQLQHAGRVGYQQLNSLKRQFTSFD
jgi:Zn-dependent peptidase ImmA (M78 family)